MSRPDDQLVADILEACGKLAEIVSEGRSQFDRNWKVRSAAERQLEIIGTAANNLSEEVTRKQPELAIRQAKDMRNLISHEYFRVDPDTLWHTISTSVPRFAQQLIA